MRIKTPSFMKRVATGFTSFVLVLSMVSSAMPFFVSEAAGALPAVSSFPSTNADNIAAGNRPNVSLVSNTPTSVTLEFKNPTNSQAFFEYRIDGVVRTIGTAHYNPCKTSAAPLPSACGGLRYISDEEVYYNGTTVNVDNRTTATPQTASVTKTIAATTSVEVRLALGGERSWDFDWTIFNVAAPAPFVKPCLVTPQVLTTDLNSSWPIDETRATGHNELVANGLRVYTEGSTNTGPRTDGVPGTWNTDKAARYRVVNFALEYAGVPNIEFASYSNGRPSLQLGFDKDANGTWDGYLVYEPWAYGDGNYWSSKDFGVEPGMGYASFGTLNQYLAANPNARIISIGYSLGSGVLGDAVISKLTAGCVDYTFDKPAVVTPPVTPPTTPPAATPTTNTTTTVGTVSPLPSSTGSSSNITSTTLDVLGVTTPDADEEETLGAQTEKQTAKAGAVQASDKGWIIFGLAWYWWFLILLALGALAWFIAAYRRRRSEEN